MSSRSDGGGVVLGVARWPQVQSRNPQRLSEAMASFIERLERAALEFLPDAIRRFSADRWFASLRDLYDRIR